MAPGAINPPRQEGEQSKVLNLHMHTSRNRITLESDSGTNGRGAMLDLILTNKEGPVGNVKLKGSLSCSYDEMVEFKILRATRREFCKLTTLDFRRPGFGLFRDLFVRVPWDKALQGKWVQEVLVDKGKATDITYLDLCKASDNVLHDILVSKLKRHGFDG
ncbi:hypothetical protein llap_3761 [Limosa lapponica baueri]|uniref:Glycerol kinase n=1 Tax=Limosa lapponica baueri TaxID=1758121 RepID=A0A2I0UIS8_LIMLA|nr:hypothetical protein llap_3761 [Limosa lapponica baueri]